MNKFECFICRRNDVPLDDVVPLRGTDQIICVACRDKIRDSFKYYMNGEEVDKDEFDRRRRLEEE